MPHPTVQAAACGIVENSGIPGNIKNGGIRFPPISHDISERPAGGAARSRRRHWECDTVAGKTAQAVSTILLQALQEQSVKSLTPDRRKDSPIMPLSRRPWTVCRFISRRRISHGSREATKIPIAYSGSIFPKEWTSRHLQKPMCKLFLQN